MAWISNVSKARGWVEEKILYAWYLKNGLVLCFLVLIFWQLFFTFTCSCLHIAISTTCVPSEPTVKLCSYSQAWLLDKLLLEVSCDEIKFQPVGIVVMLEEPASCSLNSCMVALYSLLSSCDLNCMYLIILFPSSLRNLSRQSWSPWELSTFPNLVWHHSSTKR